MAKAIPSFSTNEEKYTLCVPPSAGFHFERPQLRQWDVSWLAVKRQEMSFLKYVACLMPSDTLRLTVQGWLGKYTCGFCSSKHVQIKAVVLRQHSWLRYAQR